MYAIGGICISRCGDGIVAGNEGCDDTNPNSGDGCSAICQVEPGFYCQGRRPSVCYRTSPIPPIPPIPIPDPIPTPSNNLVLAGPVKFNYNNVMLSLVTPKDYPGLSDYDKKNFMKYNFPDRTTQPTSVYCIQNSRILRQFDCLLVYASGLPNRAYSVNFSYSYNGDSGSLLVPINPLANNPFNTRSLR